MFIGSCKFSFELFYILINEFDENFLLYINYSYLKNFIIKKDDKFLFIVKFFIY